MQGIIIIKSVNILEVKVIILDWTIMETHCVLINVVLFTSIHHHRVKYDPRRFHKGMSQVSAEIDVTYTTKLLFFKGSTQNFK